MLYRIRIKFPNRTKDYGTGDFGKGKPYKTRKGAEKKARWLSKVHDRKTKIIIVKD